MNNASNTLIISTYNWPEALNLVLLSVKAQKILPNEVIIADDGSSEATKNVIENHQQNFPIPIIHLWHEDVGFTKSVILNKAIVKAKGEYIIQIDGDCIIHKNFIKDHLNSASKGTYLFGSRVNIQHQHLSKLFLKNQIKFNFLSRGIKKRTRALYLPFLSLFYNKSNIFSKKYRGCNTSYFRKDALSINGYDENFVGWGREDSEFALRLHNNNVKGKRLRYQGILYHIFHAEKSKEWLESNNEIEQTTLKNKTKKCINGLDKYLNESK